MLVRIPFMQQFNRAPTTYVFGVKIHVRTVMFTPVNPIFFLTKVGISRLFITWRWSTLSLQNFTSLSYNFNETALRNLPMGLICLSSISLPCLRQLSIGSKYCGLLSIKYAPVSSTELNQPWAVKHQNMCTITFGFPTLAVYVKFLIFFYTALLDVIGHMEIT